MINERLIPGEDGLIDGGDHQREISTHNLNKNETPPDTDSILAATTDNALPTPSNDNTDNISSANENVEDFSQFDLDDLLRDIQRKAKSQGNREDEMIVEGLINKMAALKRMADGDTDSEDNELINVFDDEPSTTPIPPKPPPGSLLSDIARPPSPTNICDFPYFDLEPPDVDYKLSTRPTTILPKFSVNKLDLDKLRRHVDLTQDNVDDWDDDEVRVNEVATYSVIADIGTYGRTFTLNAAKVDRGDLADSGANCSMTANLSLLENVQKLKQPIIIGLAVSSDGSISSSSECTHIGELRIWKAQLHRGEGNQNHHSSAIQWTIFHQLFFLQYRSRQPTSR